MNCGAPVGAAPGALDPGGSAPAPDRPAPAAAAKQSGDGESLAERRQLTVLFCDLVGSTAISERLDPEDYRALIAGYRAAVSGVIERYGGHVANYVGDGVVAFFGYPVAQEGGTYAAALSALDLVELAPDITVEGVRSEIALNVRVGLHTGSVVVGETSSGHHIEKMSLFGDVPNVAARIQSACAPGQVVASAVTRRLIGPQLVFEPMGLKTLAGVREPMELFRVCRPKSAFDMAKQDFTERATPMVGRRAEIALVETRWEAAAEGDGQVMVVTGEAGIGKSRIVFSLSHQLPDSAANRFALFGSPIRKSSAFYSVKATLSAMLRFADADGDEERRSKLDRFLDDFGLDRALLAPPLAGLLGFADGVTALTTTSPERQKLEIINALLQICAAMAEERPLLMILEDVHWIDPSTIEFVSRWIDALQGRSCLTLVTARPEFASPWKNLPHVTGLELNRLGRKDTVTLIEKIAGKRPPKELEDQIVSRTDGVPLFIEELTKMIVETGLLDEGAELRGDLTLAIPESLQDSLMARLDRLAAVKEVAQIAAAIGRNFTRDVLAKVQRRSDQEIEDALGKLLDADLIVPVGGIGEKPSYRFRHALVQDAAYQSMLRSSRAGWHGRIAAVLERDFPEETAREPELLGHHFMLAGNYRSAEGYKLAAARMALARSANVEAIEHLGHALDCLRHSEPSPERDRREMDLQIMIAVPLAFVRGYAHKSVRSAYERARELCREYGEMERLFKVVYGQFRSNLLGGEYAQALENAEILVSLLSEVGDPLLIAATERSQGAVLTYLGRPDEAVAHLAKGAASDISVDDRVRGLDFDVVDLKVALNGYLALSNWLRGCTGEAMAAISAALGASRETDHPFSVSFAVAFATWVHQFNGDDEAVEQFSARLIALSEENTFQFWMGWGRVMNAWSRRAELGEKALSAIADGLAEWRATGSLLGLSYFLYLHADTAVSLGQDELAETVIAEAEAFQTESGEAFWEPQLIRLRSDIAFARGDEEAGIALLREAMAAAERLGLGALELRAAIAFFGRSRGSRNRDAAAKALRQAIDRVAPDDPVAAEARDLLRMPAEEGRAG